MQSNKMGEEKKYWLKTWNFLKMQTERTMLKKNYHQQQFKGDAIICVFFLLTKLSTKPLQLPQYNPKTIRQGKEEWKLKQKIL